MVTAYRRFGKMAEGLDLQVSVEMYPGNYVGTAQDAIDFIPDRGYPTLGLNPDLGNLVRVQNPVESWEEAAQLKLSTLGALCTALGCRGRRR